MTLTPERATILVVDDTPENIDVLSGVLRGEYKVKAALNGDKALRIASAESKPDMILLDVMMPEMDGYEVCRRLKADPATARIPVIFITAKSEQEDERRGLELGAVDYITKPISPPIVKVRVRTHLALYDQQRELRRMVDERTEELVRTRMEIIRRLGRAAEFKDNETGLHVIRMSHYSRLMAQALEISEEWTDLVFHAAPMHDIGKIGIPDSVLLKPGKLDDKEWEIMRQHPAFGAQIIGDDPSELMLMSKEIAMTHHEKWDGSGYPNRIAAEDIPLPGRIIAIADVFDALTSERPYKKAWPVEKAVAVIDEGAGVHFDPKLIPVFHEILPEALEIKERYAEESVAKPDDKA
ncbi:response regulator [Magnetofaba australis]|uniref:Putative response regulator receiver modulated metal dependent phosphohydrolase n=1 Tax=Magnetofaba australis IT-1 TaxID=1434232 RepID=A0A1Y2K198_9PROT|nr:two-component system response regulator [Magnetofaba australis]OSM01719.1 putative response regulator receiver modulated metal dependent phosphohydrolase [Magnetofaba australis IT-1]